ncbi:MAG TPA: Mpo1-like protein [Kofleriaceae bacterium]|nr:Mpo1-like protein [Kofleriaceae bacterium]
MKTLEQHLSTYATYHRDRRNIATHFVGIPMIVLAVATLLSRPILAAGSVPLSPAVLVVALAVAFYLSLDRRFGVAMAALLALTLWPAHALAAGSTGLWLAAGGGLFVLGWIIQFVGHIFEGRKPAFVDDLVGLLIGPLFIVAEAAFALGLRRDLHRWGQARGS